MLYFIKNLLKNFKILLVFIILKILFKINCIKYFLILILIIGIFDCFEVDRLGCC